MHPCKEGVKAEFARTVLDNSSESQAKQIFSTIF